MRELHERIGDPGHAFAYYLYDRLETEIIPDEMATNESGDGVAQIGHRLLLWNGQGFGAVHKCETVAEAFDEWAQAACEIGDHAWSDMQTARFTGNPHWRCWRCGDVSLDNPDGDVLDDPELY